MNDQREIETILKQLEPLFESAEKNNKWFKVVDTPDDALMIFTPKELRALHELGIMIWSPQHWELIDPIGRHHKWESQ